MKLIGRDKVIYDEWK